jgi:CRP/FNR family transcriptional regulator, cyclic AMP receptor protein
MAEAPVLDFEHLKRYSMFGGITPESFETVRQFIHVEKYNKGDHIVEEGSVNDRVYFICSGAVEVLKHLAGEAPDECRRITVMKTGETFGEMELIDVQPCAATVRAMEDTRTLTLSNHDLYRVSKTDMKTYTLLIMNLARELSRRIRTMDTMISGERPSSQIGISD